MISPAPPSSRRRRCSRPPVRRQRQCIPGTITPRAHFPLRGIPEQQRAQPAPAPPWSSATTCSSASRVSSSSSQHPWSTARRAPLPPCPSRHWVAAGVKRHRRRPTRPAGRPPVFVRAAPAAGSFKYPPSRCALRPFSPRPAVVAVVFRRPPAQPAGRDYGPAARLAGREYGPVADGPDGL